MFTDKPYDPWYKRKMTSKKPTVSMIAVLGARTRALGKDNKLIWHIPEDLKHFRQITEGHPIIMGHTTFESIGRSLPNRINIIVTRDEAYKADGCIVCHSPEEALARAGENEKKEIFIIGGGQIYNLFLPVTDKLYLTLVDDDTPGDTYFPEYQKEFPHVLSGKKGAEGALHYTFIELTREQEAAKT